MNAILRKNRSLVSISTITNVCGQTRRPITSTSQFSMTSVNDNDDTPTYDFTIRQQMSGPPAASTSTDATGRVVWPSLFVLWERLRMDDGDYDKYSNILELGSGCGLLSMALSQQHNGRRIVATDHPSALSWLESNIHLNKDRLRHSNTITVAPLSWDDHAAARRLVQTKGPFDLILGSDLLYIAPSDYPNLMRTIQIVSNDGAAPVYMAYPKRGTGEDAFLVLARKEGFAVQTTDIGDDQRIDSAMPSVSSGKRYEMAILQSSKQPLASTVKIVENINFSE